MVSIKFDVGLCPSHYKKNSVKATMKVASLISRCIVFMISLIRSLNASIIEFGILQITPLMISLAVLTALLLISINPAITRLMGPTWGRQDPGGPHVGPINLAIWVSIQFQCQVLIIIMVIYKIRLHTCRTIPDFTVCYIIPITICTFSMKRGFVICTSQMNAERLVFCYNSNHFTQNIK